MVQGNDDPVYVPARMTDDDHGIDERISPPQLTEQDFAHQAVLLRTVNAPPSVISHQQWLDEQANGLD